MNDTTQPGTDPTQPPPASLLDHDTLVMQQITGVMSNDFEILDAAGNPAGLVRTQGGAASRMFMGSRELDVTELDGTVLAHVSDTISVGRDRFSLTSADGTPLAELVKRITLFTTKVDIEMTDGPALELQGSFIDLDFRILAGEVVAAQVARQWAGIGRGLLGHSRYVVQIRQDAPADVRRTILGTCVALDLIRRKQSNN